MLNDIYAECRKQAHYAECVVLPSVTPKARDKHEQQTSLYSQRSCLFFSSSIITANLYYELFYK
jgi:hypothetical protein